MVTALLPIGFPLDQEKMIPFRGTGKCSALRFAVFLYGEEILQNTRTGICIGDFVLSFLLCQGIINRNDMKYILCLSDHYGDASMSSF